jgi:periplasmic protein TonB
MKFLLLLLLTSAQVIAQDTLKKEAFTIVEEMPEPPGGISAFYKYVGSNIQYPHVAREQGLQGKCYLRFVVKADGTIADVKVLKGVPHCPSCDAEAVRVIRSYPEKWMPGKQNGRQVDVYYNFPVSFKTVVYQAQPAPQIK